MMNFKSEFLIHTCTMSAANLTTNIDGEACQGEVMILMCTGHSLIHRWTFETEASSVLFTQIYTARQSVPGTIHMELYNFTLISAFSNWFESSVSIVLTTEINNTVAKCVDVESEEELAIRIAGLVAKFRQSQ